MELIAALMGLLAQAGPVGYYKGDDTPPTAADSSPNARDGVYNGATTSATKPTLLFANASSMSFDGVDDVVTAASFPWASGGPVTIAFWNFVPTGSVQNSSAFTIGAQDGANRFHAHAPWGDNTLYWDYGDLDGTGRISTSYAAFITPGPTSPSSPRATAGPSRRSTSTARSRPPRRAPTAPTSPSRACRSAAGIRAATKG